MSDDIKVALMFVGFIGVFALVISCSDHLRDECEVGHTEKVSMRGVPMNHFVCDQYKKSRKTEEPRNG